MALACRSGDSSTISHPPTHEILEPDNRSSSAKTPIHYNEEEEEEAKEVGSANRGDDGDDNEGQERPRLIRQGTFTIDDDDNETDEENKPNRSKTATLRRRRGTHDLGRDHLLSSTLHAGGLRDLLDRANADRGGVAFPPEVKAYIASHFRMIRDENESLRRTLDERTRQLDRMSRSGEEGAALRREAAAAEARARQAETQLERERAKTKAMSRRMKQRQEEEDDLGIDMYIDGVTNVPGGGGSQGGTSKGEERARKKAEEYREKLEETEREIDNMRNVRFRNRAESGDHLVNEF